MSISPISSASGNMPVQATQRSTEATEVNAGGKDRDGDSDDGVSSASAVKPPTVNTSGQITGQIVNVTA